MVGMHSHPPGVSRKSVMTLGANPTQSPIVKALSATVAPDSSINSSEVFQNLISSIEAQNRMVRKLNILEHYHREDHNYIKVVSNDEVEVELPNINLFMNITNNTTES